MTDAAEGKARCFPGIKRADLTLSGSLAYTLRLLLSVMSDLGCLGALREQE